MKQVIFKNEAVAKSRALADIIKGNMTVNVTGDTASVTETVKRAAWKSSLPEGITEETVEAVMLAGNDFTRANHVAVGEIAAGVFKEHKNVNRVSAVTGVYGSGDLQTITVDRSRTFMNSKAKEGEDPTVVKALYMTESTTLKGASFKSLKKAMSEEFKD